MSTATYKRSPRPSSFLLLTNIHSTTSTDQHLISLTSIHKMHCNQIFGAILLLLQFLSANAFWRLLCDGSVGLARIDPLMYSGEVSDHVHTIKGGSGKFLNPCFFFFACCNPYGTQLVPLQCTSHVSIAVSHLFQS